MYRIIKQMDGYRPYYIIQKRFLFIWWTCAIDHSLCLKFYRLSSAEEYLEMRGIDNYIKPGPLYNPSNIIFSSINKENIIKKYLELEDTD
jgi:hypothetical protein